MNSLAALTFLVLVIGCSTSSASPEEVVDGRASKECQNLELNFNSFLEFKKNVFLCHP